MAVLEAEARPVPPQAPSVAQEWLRPSQRRQLPSPPPVEPPHAVDRDQKRIMQTHSWIKLVLSLRSSKGGEFSMNVLEGLGLASWQQGGLGWGRLLPVQGMRSGLPFIPIITSQAVSPVGTCSVPSRGQTLAGLIENKLWPARPWVSGEQH